MSYSHTIGYGFAYFAWMRLAPSGSYRQITAAIGQTFFLSFESIQTIRNSSDETNLTGEQK